MHPCFCMHESCCWPWKWEDSSSGGLGAHMMHIGLLQSGFCYFQGPVSLHGVVVSPHCGPSHTLRAVGAVGHGPRAAGSIPLFTGPSQRCLGCSAATVTVGCGWQGRDIPQELGTCGLF